MLQALLASRMRWSYLVTYLTLKKGAKDMLWIDWCVWTPVWQGTVACANVDAAGSIRKSISGAADSAQRTMCACSGSCAQEMCNWFTTCAEDDCDRLDRGHTPRGLPRAWTLGLLGSEPIDMDLKFI